jgi:hypothetical protein
MPTAEVQPVVSFTLEIGPIPQGSELMWLLFWACQCLGGTATEGGQGIGSVWGRFSCKDRQMWMWT